MKFMLDCGIKNVSAVWCRSHAQSTTPLLLFPLFMKKVERSSSERFSYDVLFVSMFSVHERGFEGFINLLEGFVIYLKNCTSCKSMQVTHDPTSVQTECWDKVPRLT